MYRYSLIVHVVFLFSDSISGSDTADFQYAVGLRHISALLKHTENLFCEA